MEQAASFTLRVLPRSSSSLMMKQLNLDEHGKALELIHDAAKRGDNVGEGEIPDLETLDLWLEYGKGWTFHNLTTPDKFEALILLLPSRFSRSSHPTLCNLHLITGLSFSTRQARGDLVDIALELIPTLAKGYTGCLTEVFVTCLDHLLGFEQQGFSVTAVVPKAGKLAGQKGYISNYILYKRLVDGELPIPRGTVVSTKTECVSSFVGLPYLAPIPSFLPFEIPLRNGTTAIVRAMARDEVPLFYEAVIQSSKDGLGGYGWDELESYNHFLRCYVHNFSNMTFQEKDNEKRIIGYLNIGPSPYSRRWNDSKLMDGNIVLMPEFRGSGLWAVIINLCGALAIDCGFQISFSDTPVSNFSSLLGLTRQGHTQNGVIPRAIYYKDVGWMSVAIFCKPYGDDAKKLRDTLKQRKNNSKL